MKRLTRTKLEKLLYIHDCRVDQIVEAACSELDTFMFRLVRKRMIESIADKSFISELGMMLRSHGNFSFDAMNKASDRDWQRYKAQYL